VQHDEWSALLELLSGDSPQHREFWNWRMATYQQLIDRRAGQWWLGWSEGESVTTAGIFWSTIGAAPLASIQHVFTREDRRNLGFCTTLIGTMVTAHRKRRPQDEIVIIAKTGGQAERVYQRVGFRRVCSISTLIGLRPVEASDLATFHSHHACDAADGIKFAEVVKGRLNVALLRRMGNQKQLR
jgi:predicted GNAT family N-acyltransferase